MPKQVVGAEVNDNFLSWEDWVKKLFVVEPLEVEKDVKTIHGESDAVRANVYVVLNADGTKYEAFEDALIFPKVLQSQVRRQIGNLVVGRLTQGEKKQPGRNAPWIFATPTTKDLAAANALLANLSVVSASEPDSEGEDYADDTDDDESF